MINATFQPWRDLTTPVRFMTFSVHNDAMSEFADGDFEVSDSFSGDIFQSIRATENSKLNNQKQVKLSLCILVICFLMTFSCSLGYYHFEGYRSGSC